MSTYVFDCETNGLLDELDRVHCLVLKDVDSSEVFSFEPHEVEEGVRMLLDAEAIIAHNAIGFDIPALQKVYPWFKPERTRVIDTLVISRLIWTNLKDEDFTQIQNGKAKEFPKFLAGSHSLKAWGLRLAELKDDYQGGWDTWSPEMQEYCVQDVEVLDRLWKLVSEQDYAQQAIDLEHEVAWIVCEQERRGFAFDRDAAVKLLVELSARKEKLESELQDTFKPWWSSAGVHEPKRTVRFKDVLKGDTVQGAAYTRIKLTSFNPGSRHHIADRLKRLRGWKPKEMTESGQPKVDETVLSKLKYPEARLLAEYFMLQKRLGQLSEGKNSWLQLERNGRIHGRVNTNGAATGRMTHSHPNVTQVPSVRKPYGKECRSLFIAGPGKKIVGADVAGLELRMLAHYMARYDNGAYGKVILEGDVHTHNQKAAGLPTRDNAKTFIYGFMYGAGDVKLGEIVKPTAGIRERRAIGASLRKKFLTEIPALGELTERVKFNFNKNGFLKGLDGRKLLVRSEHSALNMLLQGGGAIVCKQWMVEADDLLQGYEEVCGQVATVHDELQYEVDEGHVDEIGKLVVAAIEAAGNHFQLRIPLTGEYQVGDSWAETH